MLLGTYAPKLDEKGRLILPARFRDDFAGGLVLTRGQERCVSVYSEAAFAAKLAEYQEAPQSQKRARDNLRVFMSGASPETPDKQNRVTVPQNLREWAGLERDLTVIGVGDHAEIWSTAAWEAYYAGVEDDFSETDDEAARG